MTTPASVAQIGPPNVTQKLSGPYLTMSAAYAAGLRGWPLVVMTAIAGRESGWNNDPPHTDTNGISSTGLWQINSSSTAGLTDPLGNAQAMVARLGGNSMGGLSAWALAPPGTVALNGIKQPDPYPWGTVPPVAAGDSGYYVNGQFVQHNYSLAPSLIAQALYAYGQLQAFGPATKSELNSGAWGSTGGSAALQNINPNGPAADTSTVAAGQCSAKPIFTIPHTSFGPTGCNLKAFKGALLVGAGGGVLLFGVALIVISGFAGKGPLSPVVDIAGGYVAGARKATRLSGSSGDSGGSNGPSEAEVTASDRRIIARQQRKDEKSIPAEVNYSGGRHLRAETAKDKSAEPF